MNKNTFTKLLAFLADLEQGKIHYALAHARDSAIMVIVTVPGERWEVEFFEDGSIEIEKFVSNGEIYGEEALTELVAKYSDNKLDDVIATQDNGFEMTTENRVVEQA
jgi:hypothetical protein